MNYVSISARMVLFPVSCHSMPCVEIALVAASKLKGNSAVWKSTTCVNMSGPSSITPKRTASDLLPLGDTQTSTTKKK